MAQSLRGIVLDAQSNIPLPGASIRLMGPDSTRGAVTDLNGQFGLSGLGLGRINLRVSYVGYKPQTVTGVLLSAGKEASVTVLLQETVQQQATVVIRADRSVLTNEFATLSARSFDVEQTRRFAGSRNDPARMAANFAGVSANNDARNDIIVRGNSPLGMLWRLEGIDIPNPSHFGALGATGGPVTMLNNNTLARSDFFTGAFPANYGNAQSGVFDLALRTGNPTHREYTGQIGFNGFELGAEGPFTVGKRGTYLVNYRYSVTTLLHKLGVSTGTGSAAPNYQDFTAKIDLPMGRPGNRISLFALGGTSNIDLLAEPNQSTNFYTSGSENTYNRAGSTVFGGSYTHFLTSQTSLKLTLAHTRATYSVVQDTLNDSGRAAAYYRDQSAQERITAVLQATRKLNANHTLTAGLTMNQLLFAFADSVFANNRAWRTLRNTSGSGFLWQAYAQWQCRPSDQLTLNAGLHSDYFSLTGQLTLEPRLSMRYALPGRQAVSAAVGMHSLLPSMQLLLYKTPHANGYAQTNRNLGFTRSVQAVVGYDRTLGKAIKLTIEAYGQFLYNVPVEQRASAWSAINLQGSQSAPDRDSLINAGRGRTVGLELTAERPLAKGFYVLTTLSLFKGTYAGSDGIWRNTAFNGGFVANALLGREFRLSERNTLALDLRVVTAGGQRYTPILRAASIAQQDIVYADNQSFTEQYPTYFRTDVKLTFRHNRGHVTQEWFLDVQNITNHQNPYGLIASQRNGYQTGYQYQLGLYPVFNWRIEF